MTVHDDAVRVELRSDALWITLNRPAAMNALTPRMLVRLDAALVQAAEDPAVRAVVVTGTGAAFCAGADLKAVRHEVSAEVGGLRRFVEGAAATMNRIEALPKPVLAAVNGLALAGGFEIVLACDLVIASEQARLGDAHINFALLPGGGSSVRLPRKVGPNLAKFMLFSGDSLPASAFLACGFVHEVVAADALVRTSERLVAALAKKSPLALRRMKQLVDAGLDQPRQSALQLELIASEAHFASHDMHEGLAAFEERRAPRFLGR